MSTVDGLVRFSGAARSTTIGAVMPAARTALSCCLMLVLLLTLVAPGYAWASASAQAMHDHAGMSHAGDCPECAALA